MSAMAGRRLGLMTAKNYLQAGLAGGVPTPSAAGGIRTTISAFGGLRSALSGASGLQAARSASYGGYTTISAAGCGLPTLSSAARVHAALSAAGGGLPSLSATGSVLPALSAAGGGLPLWTAGSVFHTVSAVGAARDLGGSGGPNIVSRSGSLVVFGIAGSVVYDLLDSFLKSGDENVQRELQEGDGTWEEKLAREEGKLLELMEGHLDQIKKDREDLAQRKKKFDDESAKKQVQFDEERKVIDNGKRLLDDDRRKFHQERYEFDGGKKDGKDEKDGKFDKFLKWLEYYLRIPGKLIGLKRTLEDFVTVYQGAMVFFSAYCSLLFAGKFVEFFIACYRAIFGGARKGPVSPAELPTFCPRCGLELPRLKVCSPCAADGGVP